MARTDIIYGDHNYQELITVPRTADGGLEALPRRTAYGSPEAYACGLRPISDRPDVLIDPKDYKEVIQYCHEKKIFAMYHDRAHGMLRKWNQNGFGYCWTWSLTGGVINTREAEGQERKRLGPTSLGWLVGWSNQGYYLDAAIKGASEKGIAEAEYCPTNTINPRNFKEGWEDNALLHRPQEWWETQARNIQHYISLLCSGAAGYIAYNWWGHALQMVGVEWDESQPNNLIWVIRNSHNEDDFIRLTGSKGIADEMYGVIVTNRSSGIVAGRVHQYASAV